MQYLSEILDLWWPVVLWSKCSSFCGCGQHITSLLVGWHSHPAILRDDPYSLSAIQDGIKRNGYIRIGDVLWHHLSYLIHHVITTCLASEEKMLLILLPRVSSGWPKRPRFPQGLQNLYIFICVYRVTVCKCICNVDVNAIYIYIYINFIPDTHVKHFWVLYIFC